MIHIDTSGIDAFIRAVELDMARFDREISSAFYGWTKRIFHDIVRQSPQWSGDMAANWNYSVGSPNVSYSPLPNKAAGPVRQKSMAVGKIVYARGMEPAVSLAYMRMLAVPQPTWRDTVYIANGTPIAPYVEAQSIRIRPVNLIEGQVAMIGYTVTKEMQNGGVL